MWSLLIAKTITALLTFLLNITTALLLLFFFFVNFLNSAAVLSTNLVFLTCPVWSVVKKKIYIYICVDGMKEGLKTGNMSTMIAAAL